MIRRVNIALWLLVLLAGAGWLYIRYFRPSPVVVYIDPAGSDSGAPDGRVFAELSWKRLPQIAPFSLVEQSGQPFANSALAGKPFLASFFFSRCPSICRDLNRQVQRFQEEFAKTDLQFLSISVDPEFDTPERLREYSGEFSAADQWHFLTGKPHQIKELLEKFFRQADDGGHHTTDLFLFDRWGRYRDRFSFDNPKELQRLSETARELLDENVPPLEKVVSTRNVLASVPHAKSKVLPWLYDFQLVTSDGEEFWSRDLTGTPWIASAFFTTCPTICPLQNRFLHEIQPDVAARNASLVSITVDPETDSPPVLRQYARQMGAAANWHFLTGDRTYIQRVCSEFLGIAGESEHHSSLLVVIDRWGQVRARIDWQKEGAREALLNLLDELNREDRPKTNFQVLNFPQGADQ